MTVTVLRSLGCPGYVEDSSPAHHKCLVAGVS